VTVVVSIFGLVLMGRSYLWGVALATSLVITSVVLASTTMLPALLGFAGRNIDRLKMPWFRHDVEGRHTVSWRWSRVMQRHPLAAGLLALAVLVLFTLPAANLRLGMPDAGNGAPERTSMRAYDLVAESFGPGANGPLLVAVNLADALPGAPEAIANGLARTSGVATVVPPVVNPAGDAAVISVVPTTGPQNEATQDLVHSLRDDVLPPVVDETGGIALVGGRTALLIDDSEYTAARLPLLIGGIVVRRRRAGEHGQDHHCGGGHYGRRLLGIRSARRRAPQAGRPRHGGSHTG
jgi:RND superfamily putative drug exporter